MKSSTKRDNGYSVGVVSLGCDKNRVDSEIILHNLSAYGFNIVNDPSVADCIIVNTCAFIQPARKEAIETVNEMAEYKQKKCKALIVTGCLPIKESDNIEALLPDVDLFIGFDYTDIAEKTYLFLQDKNGQNVKKYSCGQDYAVKVSEGERILTTQSHYAYLKIADGCNNYCSYCTIPYIRGRFRSRSHDSIVFEALQLAKKGVSELILVAQDVTRYGYDFDKTYHIVSLLKDLSLIDGITKIRLLYCYPEIVTDELLDEIASNPKIAKYIDIPLQHVSDKILSAMNRRSSKNDIYKLFDKLQTIYPMIAVRSTFICGFPTETRKDVREIEDFLRKYKLRNVGFFSYSREKGTKAADMHGQIPAFIKSFRTKKLYAVQEEISLSLNTQTVGKNVSVTIDGKEADVFVGRIDSQCPDIDGCVYISTDEKLQIGKEYNTLITSCNAYDLFGEVIEEEI